MKRKALACLLLSLSVSVQAGANYAEAPTRTPASNVILYVPWETPQATCQTVAKWTSDKPRVFSAVMRNTFVDNFNTMPALANGDGSAGKWAPHLDGGYYNGKFAGYDWEVKRYQPAAHEQHVYTDPNFKGSGTTVLNLNPFSVSDGILTITADRTPPALLPSVWNHAYTSGLLSTHEMFAQTYGYFEMSAQVPSSQALLPAFWMLPIDRSWPPEIDIMEAPANLPNVISLAAHWVNPDTSVITSSGCKIPSPGFAAGFHTYGVLWLPDRIVYYYDRLAIGQIATKPGMDKPFYMMINMAVGGDWQGFATDASPFPQRMLVDWVAAFSTTGPAGCAKDARGVLLCK
ncbi:family 16 glycosylhydrolase [Herbaspirillum sp. YR522]|uniref:glycoside hydrolase family 16 protein n=1 Tax=Herbaspirillum sp. YR522 TaxID=1144342 RepID=UPI00026F7FF8|nr:glycoside hydrolase family 16 protein [Herbaspirillum sp. YR522]EJM96397.1 beta-glucanase/beta-glucan synthetase [Herbaspirillum sp. YR522]